MGAVRKNRRRLIARVAHVTEENVGIWRDSLAIADCLDHHYEVAFLIHDVFKDYVGARG